MRDSDLHLFAGIGAALGAALIVVPALVIGGGGAVAVASQVPDDLEAISASLAMKSDKNSNQPQKPQPKPRGGSSTPALDKTPPTPVATPDDEGVAIDPDKAPPPLTGKTTASKPEAGSAAGPAAAPGADDGPVTMPGAEPVGDFNGSEYGFDLVTSGDPFFQKLKGDLIAGWEYPAILSDAGTPVGCLRLMADGTIPEVVMKESTDIAELSDSVERQLRQLSLLRNETPIPVPSHLLAAATTRWVCFKFNPKS